MWISKTVDELRARRRELLGPVALVPTMGALHAGHVSLIEAGRRLAEHVIVSIFVNPTQFGPNEDYTRYPRPIERDLTLCEQAGAAGVFAPSVEEMYPPGRPECAIEVPAVAGDLEGAHRPGHFRGVCRVCAKLFNMTQPDVACFGRKDYQQLVVIQAMVADLAMPLRIVGCPTVREGDGLAMSSRNVYLQDHDRKLALGLSKALDEARMMVEQAGEADPHRVEQAMAQVMTAHHMKVDYAAVRHPANVAKLDAISPRLTGGVIALVAGHAGKVRLLDNALLAAP
ncbi:MAG: pantoate--beta-alanine ligase [Phycisphaeraceae bacterium]